MLYPQNKHPRYDHREEYPDKEPREEKEPGKSAPEKKQYAPEAVYPYGKGGRAESFLHQAHKAEKAVVPAHGVIDPGGGDDGAVQRPESRDHDKSFQCFFRAPAEKKAHYVRDYERAFLHLIHGDKIDINGVHGHIEQGY